MSKSSKIHIFNDQLKVNSVTANKLTVMSNKINNIPLENLLNSSRTNHVKGLKNIQKLKVNEIYISDVLNNIPLTFLNATENELKESKKMDFYGDINVRHLNVRNLNGFDVPKELRNLFLKENQTVIQGDLFVRNILNVDNLYGNHIMNIPINNFMTTSTSQTIESDVFIMKFHANLISVNTINNDVVSNFARTDEANLIEIPTKFMVLHVKENLNIQDPDVDLRSFVGLIKRHVIGTEASDLAQVYNGRVLIRGTLTIHDLKTYSPKTKIIVNTLQVPLNISSYYWTKSTRQEIYVDDFSINNSVKINGIVTKYLNNHPVSNYLRTDNHDFQGAIIVRFGNAIVEGNVNGHPDNFPSFLKHLSQNVIPIDGAPTLISSSIEFRNKVVIKDLFVNSINDVPSNTFVHKHLRFAFFEAPKSVESIETKNLIVDNSLSLTNYNNVNLKTFAEEALRIDRPIMLNTLKIKSFHAFNLTIDNLEEHNFDEMMANFQEELDFARHSNKGKRTLRIHGDATFNKNIFIDLLNSELEFNEFINMLAVNSNEPQEIGGRKIFQKGLNIIENLSSDKINEFSTQRLLYQSLCRGDKQTITGQLFVKNLRLKELHTNKLNEISWDQLVDREKLNSPLKINLQIDEMEVENLYTISETLDFSEMLKIIQTPKRLKWNSITAMKGCEVIFGTDGYLDRLINDGVIKR